MQTTKQSKFAVIALVVLCIMSYAIALRAIARYCGAQGGFTNAFRALVLSPLSVQEYASLYDFFCMDNYYNNVYLVDELEFSFVNDRIRVVNHGERRFLSFYNEYISDGRNYVRRIFIEPASVVDHGQVFYIDQVPECFPSIVFSDGKGSKKIRPVNWRVGNG